MTTRTTIAMLLAVGTFLALAGAAEATVTDVGLYRLGEDDAGAVAGGLGNNPTTAAVGTNATRYGDPTYSANTPGAASTLSMDFDDVGDHYRAPVYDLGTNNWGMEAWVYSTDAGNNGWAFSNGRHLIGQFFGNFKWHRNGQGDVANVPVAPNAWHHMALVRDGGTLTAYFDGVPVTTTNRTDTWDWGFAIGARPGGDELWEGQVDHVRLFTFAPGQFNPATDLTLDMSGGSPPPPVTVVADLGQDYQSAALGETSGTINGNAGIPDTAGTGSWDYLQADSGGANESLLTYRASPGNSGNPGYGGAAGGSEHGYFMPALSDDKLFNDGVTSPPDAVNVHPGNEEPREVIARWTAGQAGDMNVAGYFQDVAPTQTGIAYAVRLNGVAQLSGSTAGNVPFDLDVTVAIGDTIDFVVGPNGTFYADESWIKATITTEQQPIPEPATMGAVGLAVAGLGGYIRRRRKA